MILLPFVRMSAGQASTKEPGLGKVMWRMVPSVHLAECHSLSSHVHLSTGRIVSTKQTEKEKSRLYSSSTAGMNLL